MSKIQFNLLPDSRLEHNKAILARQKFTKIAYMATAGSLTFLLLMVFVVDVVQKKQLNDSAKQIDTVSKQLSAINGLDNIVTVQNQLGTLVNLHQSKHMSSRLFTYLPELTPANVTINKLETDFKQNTMVISGTAGNQAAVNTFVDTLKQAKYKVGSTDAAAAFSSVIESGFTITASSIGYTISLQFDPNLFANNVVDSSGKPQAPQLIVKKTSTGSLNPSTTLFNSSQSGTGAQQ